MLPVPTSPIGSMSQLDRDNSHIIFLYLFLKTGKTIDTDFVLSSSKTVWLRVPVDEFTVHAYGHPPAGLQSEMLQFLVAKI